MLNGQRFEILDAIDYLYNQGCGQLMARYIAIGSWWIVSRSLRSVQVTIMVQIWQGTTTSRAKYKRYKPPRDTQGMRMCLRLACWLATGSHYPMSTISMLRQHVMRGSRKNNVMPSSHTVH